jgi:DNA-binding response OmpR family regulator
MRGTILLVEDDYSMGRLVQGYLEHEEYRVVYVRTGAEALTEVGRHPIDLVLLDVGLPDVDGFDVCREIRTRSRVPVIMLTARDEEADRVAGLEVGADDYVCKPFSPRELMARIKAVLRRVEAGPVEGPAVMGDVAIDRDGRRVTAGGGTVDLTAREFDLLVYLVENAGVVLSRDRLLETVWGMEYPGGTRTVDVHVASLRRKLARPDLIETVRGVGYKVDRP